jgi:adenine-specific DNA-methyltransferase
MSKKHTGSYYTPFYLAEFISNRVLTYFEDTQPLNILEPSVGDGVFINAIQKNQSFKKSLIEIVALDINGQELLKAKNNWGEETSSFIKIDFLDYCPQKKFSLIIGNPPYIRKNRLDALQLNKCKAIHSSESLSIASVKNIWTSFVVKSSSLLKDNGMLAFILPLELLQVKFTEEIRDFLQTKFQRLEIFTFNDLMFECKGQDTLILIAYKKASRKGVFYTNIESESQLRNNKFALKQNKALVSSKVKWTHHLLNSEEIEFLEGLKRKLNSIDHYCASKAGIVTAANDYFIINSKTEKQYCLSKYTKPIIKKGSYVNGSVVFDETEYKELVNSNLPSKLIVFKDNDKENLSQTVNKYLKIGEEQNLPSRYKCIRRNNWFVIPHNTKQSAGFFFKRCHLYPRLLKNAANVFVTDSAYQIDMREGFDINSLICSFYNSLTLTFAELTGRYYGGGVLELTPNEFKSLPVPYLKITDDTFEEYRKEFQNKKGIDTILEANDFKVLNTVMGLTEEEISKIQHLRVVLMNKRLKSSSVISISETN